jgi:hypothetical protein
MKHVHGIAMVVHDRRDGAGIMVKRNTPIKDALVSCL